MKRENLKLVYPPRDDALDIKRVYQPRGDALDIRVRNTLSMLSDEPARRMSMKKMIALALAAVLVLASVVALAAGMVMSDRMDMQTMAERALEEQYGLTKEMLSLFNCELDERAGTATFKPIHDAIGTAGERLGTYTVAVRGGKAQASWSFDGQTVGEDIGSPAWDAKLLGEALARKAAGEEWFEITGLYTEEQLQINVTQEQAVETAKRAVTEKFGADALDGFELYDAHAHVTDPEQVAADGHGLWRYSVVFAREDVEKMKVESYVTRLYADDGSVFECEFKEEQVAEQPTQVSDVPDGFTTWTEYYTARAFPVAAIAPKDAVALAKDAIVQYYGLTQAQADAMEIHETWTGFGLVDDKPVYDVWFGLWTNPNGSWTEGDGIYGASVNVESGAIEQMNYDSTLGGNG